MRSFLFRLPTLSLLVAIAGIGCYRYAEYAGARTMAAHLDATHIEFSCEAAPTEEAISLLHRKLAEKDPFFEHCTFDFMDAGHSAIVSIEGVNSSGTDCLRYVADLSGVKYRLRRQKVVLASNQQALRDPLKRAAFATLDWLKLTWTWTVHKISPQPPPPIDPFAPIPSPPKNPFGF